jgi:hypothetical protein
MAVNLWFVPHDIYKPVVKQTFATLKDYQDAVGGDITHLRIVPGSLGFGMYLNDNGKSERLPCNTRATVLGWNYAALSGDDAIVGNVVLVGPPDDDGNDTEVNEDGLLFKSALLAMSAVNRAFLDA